jgi:hypothetical protein
MRHDELLEEGTTASGASGGGFARFFFGFDVSMILSGCHQLRMMQRVRPSGTVESGVRKRVNIGNWSLILQQKLARRWCW